MGNMSDAPFDSHWVEVEVPSPRTITEQIRRTGKSAKTLAQENVLLGILRRPPSDFDGSNAKLASYLGVSIRTVARLLAGLKATEKIRIRSKVVRGVNGKAYTRRSIQIRSNP
jgi:hypothetical protein